MKCDSDEETATEIDVTDNIDSSKSDNIYTELSYSQCHSSTQSAAAHLHRQSDLRHKINMRERKRMHDLNVAMDSLREVMPYANGPSVRKLSKIATLSLARNYIQMLTKSVEEMKQLLDEIYRDSVQTRMHGHAAGYQASLPPRPPFTLPVHPNYPRLSSGRAGIRHISGYAYGTLHPQELGYTLGIRNVCAEIGNCGLMQSHSNDRISNQHFTTPHSGSPICDTALSESYKMLK